MRNWTKDSNLLNIEYEPKTQPMLFTIQPNHLGMHSNILI